MLKPSFLNIVFFWLAKYLVFYLFKMFKGNNFAFIHLSNIKTADDFFYYLLTFLSLPIIFIILLALPMYYSMKSKTLHHFAIKMALILLSEYAVYTFIASPSNLLDGVFNGLISITLFTLFFLKHIKSVGSVSNE